MNNKIMYRPGKLVPGNNYWLLTKYINESRLCKENIQRVVFRSYRAHPAEVIVVIDNKSVIVSRKDIYLRSIPVGENGFRWSNRIPAQIQLRSPEKVQRHKPDDPHKSNHEGPEVI